MATLKGIAVISIFVFALASAGESSFILNQEPINIFSPLRQLHIYLTTASVEVVPNDHRQAGVKGYPGDYYRFPMGARKVFLEPQQRLEISGSLSATIKEKYYDDTIIQNIIGCDYKLAAEEKNRREYFVRYAQEDTVYVISGWLGQFLSFYQAIPGQFEYSFSELQNKISNLTARKIEIPKEIFDEALEKQPYFIEYIDKNNMLRIRCYQVSEMVKAKNGNNELINNPRTIIEITRFINHDAHP